MPPITLEAIMAKQSELATMIHALHAQENQIVTHIIEIDEATIALYEGEHYAGAVLDEDGDHEHHLVLMAPRPTGKLKWQAAIDWAESVGGSLPSKQEASLLFANCKPHLKPEWHWTSHTYESDESYAWTCYFGDGYIYDGRKSYEGSAVAVRRV